MAAMLADMETDRAYEEHRDVDLDSDMYMCNYEFLVFCAEARERQKQAQTGSVQERLFCYFALFVAFWCVWCFQLCFARARSSL